MKLYSGAVLPAKSGNVPSPKTFSVTLEFVNADFDQSVLKNFGEKGEVCFRRLDAVYKATDAASRG